MYSDKIKNALTIVKKNWFLPVMAFIFSFINVTSCFIYPSNHGSLYELIANDISGAKTFEDTGLVKFELSKVEDNYNYLYAIRYYFDRIESTNENGKSFVTYGDHQTTYEYGQFDSQNIEIDYSIGIVNYSSFSKLGLSLNSGSIKQSDYSTDTTTDHCVISEDYFNALKGDSALTKEEIIGKTIKYIDVFLTIDGVVENSSFASNQMHSTTNKFIAFRYARTASKTVQYKAHMYFSKSHYYSNYSIMKDFFAYVYRKNGKDHLNISIPGNEWIVSDFVNFRKMYGNNDKAIPNKNVFIYSYLFSLVFGMIVGVIALKVVKSFSKPKKAFYSIIFALFAYYVGLFIFGFSFNHMLIAGIHINTFTSFGSLFAILYSIIFLIPIFVCSLFDDGLIHESLKEEPLVSVVIPVYNGGNYLASAISSALNQSYRNIEVVVVDDGSTDKGLTKMVATSFADERVRYFRKKNGGVATALNFGLGKAKGKYICWLSHDDILPENKILYQLLQLQEWGKEEKIIPYSDNVIINEGGFKSKLSSQLLLSVSKTDVAGPADYFALRHLIFSSLLVPAEFFEKNKFIPELLYSQDTFMFFQMLKDGYKLRYSKYGYVNYRVHSSQGSFTRANQIDADVELQNKYFLDYFNESKDTKFIHRYIMFCAKRAGGYDCYNKLFDELIADKEKFGLSSLFITRAKMKKKISSSLYTLKKKVLGR